MTKKRILGSIVLAGVVFAVLAAAGKDRPPRTSDGQPDIQGMWASATHGIYSLNYESLPHLQALGMPGIPGQITSTPGSPPPDSALLAYFKGGSIVVDPADGILPFQPWALERRNSVMRS